MAGLLHLLKFLFCVCLIVSTINCEELPNPEVQEELGKDELSDAKDVDNGQLPEDVQLDPAVHIEVCCRFVSVFHTKFRYGCTCTYVRTSL